MMLEKTIRKHWQADTLNALEDFIRIPAKSRNFDPLWEENRYLLKALTQAAQWGRERFPDGTFEIIELPNVPPTLFVDIPATQNHSGQPAFFYGHFDKQPETDGWSDDLGPWEPVVKDGKLYGRGGVDDGYSFYAAMTAALSLDEQGIKRPRITGIFETDEESGSSQLELYLSKLAPRIGQPAFMGIIDLGAQDDKRIWLTESLRGTVVLTVTVRVLEVSAHSGIASGIVPSSMRIMRTLLDRLEDSKTGEVLLKEFHTQIPERYQDALKELAELSDLRTAFAWKDQTASTASSSLDALINNTWKPTLSILGADGLPPTENAGALIRNSTALKLSFRIPPGADSRAALQATIRELTENVPYNATVEISNADANDGFVVPPMTPWLAKALDQVSETVFENKPGCIFCGASIGTLPMFARAFPKSAFINTGAMLPGSNAHAPDEWLPLEYATKLTYSLALLMASVPENSKE